MTSKKIVLTFEKDFYSMIMQRVQKDGFRNVQQYFYELARRNIYSRLKRSKKLSAEEEYLNKFSSDTKESRKLVKELKKQGVM